MLRSGVVGLLLLCALGSASAAERRFDLILSRDTRSAVSLKRNGQTWMIISALHFAASAGAGIYAIVEGAQCKAQAGCTNGDFISPIVSGVMAGVGVIGFDRRAALRKRRASRQCAASRAAGDGLRAAFLVALGRGSPVARADDRAARRGADAAGAGELPLLGVIERAYTARGLHFPSLPTGRRIGKMSSDGGAPRPRPVEVFTNAARRSSEKRIRR